MRFIHLFSILMATFSLTGLEAGQREMPVGKPFVLLTMPKTGTHLLTPFLTELTHRRRRWASSLYKPEFISCSQEQWNEAIYIEGLVPFYHHYHPIPAEKLVNTIVKMTQAGGFFGCHTPYSKKLDLAIQEAGHIVFFLLRDPRDYAVSGAHYYAKRSSDGFFPEKYFNDLNPEERISAMLKGSCWSNSTRQTVLDYTPWRLSPNCCTVRFESLVSEDEEEKLFELRKIASTLDLDHISDKSLLQLFALSFGKGPTFYKGKPGAWKTEFTEENKEIAHETLGDLLIALGYEENLDW